MYIQVTFDVINVNDVCDYYNKNKSEDQNSLEKLNRAEGGFQIKRKVISDTGSVYDNDPNNIVKQARWTRKYLTTPIGQYTFTEYEWNLLYESICSVHGKENTILHNGLND